MPANPIYLDHAATTPLLPEALAAMQDGWQLWANPSSPHAAGRAARAALEGARARMKVLLGWQGEVIFTSGASEALALGIGRAKCGQVLVSAVEHDAALRAAGGAQRLEVGPDGLVILNSTKMHLGGTKQPLIVVQQVNSETGVVQDIAAISEVVRTAGGVLLCDAAQGAGKLDIPVEADMVVLSAHKFGGPVGVGALLVRDWALLEPTGGQERGYRGGTESLPLVLGMVAALEAGNAWLKPASALRESLTNQLLENGAEIVAAESPRVPTIAAYRMPGKSSVAQLIRFDGAGIAVSAGSACSSGSLKASHVLTAMGYAHPGEVIRVSIGRETTEAETARFVAGWKEIRG
ncbi:MAG: aminotransferase [Novosphingobium sp. 28-62-57]|uniref:cysteine desulfurase family protein n=1 Tax=unclassified Novosphingobium TaxID=2644732 RepID=UPI000BCB7705|nr:MULTISPECIES: aminotransferase class V-fold PLP-dependent enzyme [unclassified Novosphingobium]OYW48236.1 MAG: aminotransferase [Novosphingobium sp. 12-62-10]OYZ10278.1 MAG: aminotransferase [Novosphingobium sp. 28-62-57]OZA34558.1 MAG: aminotransferase [Novosphingobium sp. 17-62-9]HQS71284.1 aminotransferase class V-fold PLP-dependent enzyme [Novosphingobium sp.]